MVTEVARTDLRDPAAQRLLVRLLCAHSTPFARECGENDIIGIMLGDRPNEDSMRVEDSASTKTGGLANGYHTAFCAQYEKHEG